MQKYTSIELCAGAGGQALGLHNAGFSHKVLIEIDQPACKTLELNNERHSLGWGKIIEGCVEDFAEHEAQNYDGIDLVAGGVPCPPFSKAGKQLGKDDERDLFPAAIKVVKEVNPKAVLIENVAGLLDPKFDEYRAELDASLRSLGYETFWKLHNASDFGVPQLRPRVALVALKNKYAEAFSWPDYKIQPPTVGEALYDLMASNGWEGALEWKEKANKIAPTLVGGSKKHGGPDLGPTRSKRAWKELFVNGNIVGNEPPEKGFTGYKDNPEYRNMPLLTVRMAARIQGFPDWWEFYGRKTPAYRQVGNAFPPPVAEALGRSILTALRAVDSRKKAA
ncbi:DNA cytosine methyltransferase [Vibrio parahaemolyticus]|uniref:DNA cytosine methyltransferase n=1 Tax=Vibrio parahaemolyticus TaxID=670 RepID=UPI0006A6F06C|nr:DNA cytosine methyltransferase [Vibrio parahaemolyticus]ELG4659057.1 DNA cytosine methyltransferase [Vibrio fluvialis]EHK9101485.1 DNA cytosine methyltransferase [Vibrio parahaemolyticus]EIV8512079.1 DNA cytosine methyltransferase [Vibrio parahaemolyticus]EJE8567953.1 DNA cytosine methyltransferase [Vibrio parahaemolyticus]EJG0985020.1 DNA cytosine methyltransferase [Vibrio parahaemolyticus]